VTPSEALNLLLGAFAAGSLRVDGLAVQKLNAAFCSLEDLRMAIRTARWARRVGSEWRFEGGVDLDGKPLPFTARFDHEVTITDVF